MIKDTKKILSQVKKLYWDWGWPGIYTYWRFWEYPRYLKMEKMLPKKGVIVDLGCGYGIFTNFIAASGPERRVIAMEFNKDKIRIANKGFPNVSYTTKDITQAKIPQADAIILMHVLHHLNSYSQQEEVLKECVKKLKKGGILLIDEVYEKPFWKLILTRIVDFLLYPLDKMYYRFQENMISFLKQFPLEIKKVINVDGRFMPFSQIVYLCQKK